MSALYELDEILDDGFGGEDEWIANHGEKVRTLINAARAMLERLMIDAHESNIHLTSREEAQALFDAVTTMTYAPNRPFPFQDKPGRVPLVQPPELFPRTQPNGPEAP